MNFKFYITTSIICFMFAGCANIPSITLQKANFEKLKTLKLENIPNDNRALSAISTVSLGFDGLGIYGEAGDGLNLREATLKYMDEYNISLNEIINQEFKKKVKKENLPVTFNQKSTNKIIITLNIVVLGMVHGFSDELNCRYNITGKLITENNETIWAYNAIPLSPFASGYSLTAEELFSSPQVMKDFFRACSKSMVEKLFDHFSDNLED